MIFSFSQVNGDMFDWQRVETGFPVKTSLLFEKSNFWSRKKSSNFSIIVAGRWSKREFDQFQNREKESKNQINRTIWPIMTRTLIGRDYLKYCILRQKFTPKKNLCDFLSPTLFLRQNTIPMISTNFHFRL